MTLTSADVLFLGRGNGAVSWYRTGMPSFHLGCDWIAVDLGRKSGEDPKKLRVITSLARGGLLQPPDFERYKIVILQQVFGQKWFSLIHRLRKAGITVLYEVDDYLHGVHKIAGHAAQQVYSKKLLKDFELCMKACDGMIVSTEFLAERYRKFNANIWVCQNFIDDQRYGEFELPSRRTINIGWAGGEGHEMAVRDWLPAIERIMDQRDDVRFVSIGLPVADAIAQRHQDRALSMPIVPIENFPAAMMNFDIAIAPAQDNNWYRSKSNLRLIEAGSLGIPVVASPLIYGEIQDGATGLLADGPEGAYLALQRLADDPSLRREIGSAAREYCLREYSVEKGISQWEQVFVAA